MCGGYVCNHEVPKHLFIYKGKSIVQRTIDLLKDNGVYDIAITTSPECVEKYEHLNVEIISYNSNHTPFVWLDAFYFIDEPVCYLFGDVVYSEMAIKKIVGTQTDDIDFFGSAPPFAPDYPKPWAEPFGFKVQDYRKFQRCVRETIELKYQHVWYRDPIAWELWQVIKGTPRNRIYPNYIIINDYTCDVDSERELEQWNNT